MRQNGIRKANVRTRSRLLAAAVMLAAGLLVAEARGQDNPSDVAGKSGVPSAYFKTSATGPRTSPFEPEDPNKPKDVQFIVDGAPGLDTGCTYRGGGPLQFEIPVTRFVGAVGGGGLLVDAGGLVGAGVLSATAKLTMPAFDVDSRAVVPGINPERDRVTFNGEEIGFLDGLNGEWILNSFDIQIDKVKFPDQAAAGSDPTPAMNTVSIDIDVANASDGEYWCTAIDWAKLEIKAMSPVIMVHGNGSDAGFYDRMGFVPPLRTAKYPIDGCGSCNNPINLAAGSGGASTISANGAQLGQLIPGIVQSFGADSYHLVVHSKGGLDSREFLANRGSDEDLMLISYSSLSTPHNGSVLADLAVQYSTAARLADEVEFQGFPTFTATVAEQVTLDAGTPNLTTGFVAGFNAGNLGRLPGDPVYNAVAADADLNGNGEIDRNPDEYAELRAESPELTALDNTFLGQTKTRIGVNIPYQILRNTRSIGVTYRTENVLFGLGGTRTVATITSNPTAAALGNDVLVTIPSGLGTGGFSGLTTNTATFVGANGRNHASVANAGVAARVIPWIIQAERSQGDLK